MHRWLLLLCLASCDAPAPRVPVNLERVTRDPSGRVWLAGTHGVVARVEPRAAAAMRIDLPRGERQSQESYEREAPWVLPTSTGVIAIAESGDRFRLEGDAWQPGQSIADPDVRTGSVRSAFVSADGRIGVQFATSLVWPGFAKEKLDRDGWIFWLERVGDELVGLRDGNPTELLVREGAARWRKLADVAGAAAGDSIGRWKDRYVLLHDGALMVIASDGTVQTVALDALTRSAKIATEPASGPGRGLANDQPEPPRIWALHADETGAPILHFAAPPTHGLIDLAVDPPRVLRCRLLAQPSIGVIRDGDALVAISQRGTLSRVEASGCKKSLSLQ